MRGELELELTTGEKAKLLRPDDCLGTAADLELAIDVPGVFFDRAEGDDQALGDLAIGEPLANQRQHLAFARGEGLHQR